MLISSVVMVIHGDTCVYVTNIIIPSQPPNLSKSGYNKNAYQHCVTPELLLTDLSHITFPPKSQKISLLILLNNTWASLSHK